MRGLGLEAQAQMTPRLVAQPHELVNLPSGYVGFSGTGNLHFSIGGPEEIVTCWNAGRPHSFAVNEVVLN